MGADFYIVDVSLLPYLLTIGIAGESAVIFHLVKLVGVLVVPKFAGFWVNKTHFQHVPINKLINFLVCQPDGRLVFLD